MVYNKNLDKQIMNMDFVERTRRNYDRLSSWYDLISGNAELRITRLALEKIKAQGQKRILDIGCGTGSALKELSNMAHGEAIGIGMDLSFEMCLKSREKTSGFQHSAIVCGNGLKLPFNPGSFDAILLSFTLELFPPNLINELINVIFRLLNKKGRIYVVHMAQEEHPSLISRMYLSLHKKYPGVIDCRPIQVQDTLEKYGFTILSNKKYSLWGLPVGLIEAEKKGD